MAGYRSSGGILSQYQGFPALIFFALKDSATRQHSIHERLDTLVHIFAYLRANLPERKDIETIEQKDGEKSLGEIIGDIDQKIKSARANYESIFEQEATYTEKENEFLQRLDEILYLETEIIARTKLIDSQRMSEFEAPSGIT